MISENALAAARRVGRWMAMRDLSDTARKEAVATACEDHGAVGDEEMVEQLGVWLAAELRLRNEALLKQAAPLIAAVEQITGERISFSVDIDVA
jgi:hypothetical protein